MANPVLTKEKFIPSTDEAVMTLSGVVGKTMIMLGLVVVNSALIWTAFSWGIIHKSSLFPLILGSSITGLIVGWTICAKPEWASTLAPFYALLEGVGIGLISMVYELKWHGIVISAVVITFCTMGVMLFLWKKKVIVVTERVRNTIIGATLGVVILYIIDILCLIMGIRISFLHDTSVFGLIVNLLIAGIAAFNLLLDFELIEEGIQKSAPEYMEWFGAFGLTVTLLWLYLEVLRLLSRRK